MRRNITKPPVDHWQLAEKLLALGLHEEAIVEIGKVPLQDEKSLFFLSIASQAAFATGSFGKSASLARTLLKLQPEKTINWSKLEAVTRFLLSNNARLEVYLKAAVIFPNNGSFRYSIETQICAVGKIEEAKAEIQVALALNPLLQRIALDDPRLSDIWEELLEEACGIEKS